MELMTDIEVQNIPTNLLSGIPDDGWRIADESSTIERMGRDRNAIGRCCGVMRSAPVHPRYRATRGYADVVRLEPHRSVENLHGHGQGCARDDADYPLHRPLVILADIVEISCIVESQCTGASSSAQRVSFTQIAGIPQRPTCWAFHHVEKQRYVNRAHSS